MAQDVSSSKQNKKTKGKSSKKLPSEIKVEVNFTPFEALKTKTRDKLQAVRTLTVAMLPSIASGRGFEDQQFIKLTAGEFSVPAMLLLDSGLQQSASIVSESNIPNHNFKEGEEITISSPCLRLLAEEVIFQPLSHKDISDCKPFSSYLKQKLIMNSIVIQSGNFIIIQYLTQDIILKIRSVKFFGSNLMECKAPSECIWQTCINIENEKPSFEGKIKKRITFDDIGGNKCEIEDLQQEISLLFSKEKSPIKPVKGILIIGPSGCGKSLIGEALKHEYKNKFINIDPEVTRSKFQGESEINLKQYFKRAASRAPCILFIDDLDTLCTNRDHVSSTGVITALLHLIDGLGSASMDGILVIATATKPQILDAALRRPGRISHDIVLSPPEESDREAILSKMLLRVPNEMTESDTKSIATKTPGYVGGDLHNVMVEAVMLAEDRLITVQDLENALAAVKPMSLKNSTAVDHKILMTDIFGYESLKTKLQESLHLSLNYRQLFEDCGLSPPTHYLIFGPPGCGKSSLILALATEFHLSVIRIKRSTVLGKYFGESEQNLSKLFSRAEESSPCIIHFENFEGLAGKAKSDDGGSDVEGRIINHLKVQLDGIVRNSGILIFAESNRPDLLDKDVIRPGRFHEYYLMNLPGSEDRLAILGKHLGSASFCSDISVASFVNLTDGFTVSEVIQFCNELQQQKRESEDVLFAANVEEALDIVSPSTSKKMLQRQIKFANIYCSV